MPKTIYVVTHPEASHHVERLVGGWYDSDLTANGRRHARLIGRVLRTRIPSDVPAELFSSDSLRARRTAEVIGESLGTDVITDPRLREKSYGIADGRPQSWLDARFVPPPRSGERLVHDEGIPAAETKAGFAARVFAAMAEYDLPIWMHPARTSDMTDYAAEEKSRYEIWWALGWPYETSVAMVRLVLWGLFDRYPNIKILTHHLGGMIPYFEERVGAGLSVLGARTAEENYSEVLSSLKRPHAEYFKMFYGDTAMFGSSSAFPTGVDYFGADHVCFSTDAPFAPVAETFESLKRMELEADVQAKIYKQNAERLMNRSFD